MKLRNYIGAVLDRCGNQARGVLDEHIVLGEIAAALDLADVELAQSERGHGRYKFEAVLLAGSRDGVLVVDPQFAGANVDAVFEQVASLIPPLLEIEIFEDIEDIVRAERDGRRAIMFTGIGATKYYLSWEPSVDVNVEIWSEQALFSLPGKTLNTDLGIPKFFDYLIIDRAAFACLDYLLSPEVKKDWSRFVLARKTTLREEKDNFEDRWLVFRSEIPDDGTTLRRQFYDPIDDLMHI